MNITQRHTRTSPPARVGVVISALIAAAIGACSSATDSFANLNTVSYQSALYALNGSPLGAPTAINTPTALTVRAEIGYDFDVAFDIDASGNPVVLAQRAVGLPLGGPGHQVGLQRMSGTFASVTEAPTKNWLADTLLTIAVGEVIAVRSGTSSCQYEVSPLMYSKMVVDSIRIADRRLFLSVVTDPNCGFRSFEAGRPRH